MMNKGRKIGMEILGNYAKNSFVQYVGPYWIGNYGNLYETDFNELKYVAGAAKEIWDIAGGIVIVDKNKGAKRVMENLYENGRKNYVFIDEETGYSYYFNLEDSKIIRRWLCTRGRKYVCCKEELFEIIGNYKSLKMFNRHLRDREIKIDGREFIFRKYNDFIKLLEKDAWSGYDQRFEIEVDNKTLEWIFWYSNGFDFIEVR